MRITARQLRQIIKEELTRSMMREADAPDEAAAKAAVKQLFDVKNDKEDGFPGPASKYSGAKEAEHVATARAKCKDLLVRAGVAETNADITKYVKKYAPGGDDMGEAAAVAKFVGH